MTVELPFSSNSPTAAYSVCPKIPLMSVAGSNLISMPAVTLNDLALGDNQKVDSHFRSISPLTVIFVN
jgi:hypothetical protein